MRGILTTYESQRSPGTSFVSKYGSQFYSWFFSKLNTWIERKLYKYLQSAKAFTMVCGCLSILVCKILQRKECCPYGGSLPVVLLVLPLTVVKFLTWQPTRGSNRIQRGMALFLSHFAVVFPVFLSCLNDSHFSCPVEASSQQQELCTIQFSVLQSPRQGACSSKMLRTWKREC